MKKIIRTLNAPKAVGTYSQGVIFNNLIFTSGQIAIDPTSGELIKNNFKLEIQQVLSNIDAILNEGGSSLDLVIKLNVYITSMNNFSQLNDIFNNFFNTDPPARSVVEVTSLPMGAQIKIDAIGIVN